MATSVTVNPATPPIAPPDTYPLYVRLSPDSADGKHDGKHQELIGFFTLEALASIHSTNHIHRVWPRKERKRGLQPGERSQIRYILGAERSAVVGSAGVKKNSRPSSAVLRKIMALAASLVAEGSRTVYREKIADQAGGLTLWRWRHKISAV